MMDVAGRIRATFEENRQTLIVMLAMMSLTLIGLLLIYDVVADNWKTYFAPSLSAMWSGESPYTEGIYNPPWFFVWFGPLGVAGPRLGFAMSGALSVGALIWLVRQLDVSWWGVVLVLTSLPAVPLIIDMNIDAMVSVAYLVPTTATGLILATSKPQIGIGVVVLWASYLVHGEGHTWQAVRSGLIATVVAIASLLVWRYQPETSAQAVELGWNVSLWPWSVIPAAMLMWLAFRKRNVPAAMVGSVLLSPYIAFPSWIVVMVAAVVTDLRLGTAVWMGMWVWFFVVLM